VSASRPVAAVVDRVVVPAGTTGADAVAAAGLPTNGAKAIVVVREADGRLRPEQAVKQVWIGAQLGGQRLRRPRPSFVEVIEYAQFSAGGESLATPAAKYEIHNVIGCGLHG